MNQNIPNIIFYVKDNFITEYKNRQTFFVLLVQYDSSVYGWPNPVSLLSVFVLIKIKLIQSLQCTTNPLMFLGATGCFRPTSSWPDLNVPNVTAAYLMEELGSHAKAPSWTLSLTLREGRLWNKI